MKQYVMNVKRMTKDEKLHNRKRQDQIHARQIEAKVKWMETKIKVCLVCDNKFFTESFEALACSNECYMELRRCQK